MITRISSISPIGGKAAISLRAEVMILLIIIIFGLIGLSFCIGLYGQSESLSTSLSDPAEIQTIYEPNRQAKT